MTPLSPFHKRLAQAKDAINEVFSDTSVARAQTRDALEELRDEIDGLLETLKAA